jgi:hypothetical protein
MQPPWPLTELVPRKVELLDGKGFVTDGVMTGGLNQPARSPANDPFRDRRLSLQHLPFRIGASCAETASSQWFVKKSQRKSIVKRLYGVRNPAMGCGDSWNASTLRLAGE